MSLPLTSLEKSLRRVPTQNDVNKIVEECAQSFSPPTKKLPNWLLEFESFSLKESENARPLTESSVNQKPQWFKELVQKRRLSETMVEIGKDEETKSQENDSKLQSPDIIDLLSDIKTEQKKENIRKNNSRKAKFDSIETKLYGDSEIAKSFISLPTFESTSIEKFPTNAKLLKGKEAFPSIDFSFKENCEISPVDFIIPELPKGRLLTITIKSNWGDEEFVGLNGIEILDVNAKNQVKVEKVWSDPPSTSVEVLTDGNYRTRDDTHIWVIPFKKEIAKIFIRLEKEVTVGLIRIWNYNKSRTYSYRGVRYIEMELDRRAIFKGEIERAIGELNALPEKLGDTILFTTNEDLLQIIADKDFSFQQLLADIT